MVARAHLPALGIGERGGGVAGVAEEWQEEVTKRECLGAQESTPSLRGHAGNCSHGPRLTPAHLPPKRCYPHTAGETYPFATWASSPKRTAPREGETGGRQP